MLVGFMVVLFFSSCVKERSAAVPECDASVTLENNHTIEGYTDKMSYAPGDTVHFMIHSLAPNVRLQLEHYGVTTTVVFEQDSIAASGQNYNCRSYSHGCGWDTTYQYVVPNGLPSGIYAANLTNDFGEQSYISFVIKGPAGNGSRILVMASTNTWQAYNHWSNQSFYQYDLSEENHNSTIVTFHRPNLVDNPTVDDGHLVGAELHLHRWLANNNYNFDVAADIDLHQNEALLNDYDVLMLNVHPEYWTLEMYNHMIRFLNGGGKLMYLGGNGVYWRVALLRDRIEVQKEGGRHLYTSGIGGTFRSLQMSESRHLGVQYTRAGIHTFAPYEAFNTDHWIYENTGVVAGQLIGENSLNGPGASGGETDKLAENSPENITLLGIGTNPDNGGARMIYYENPNGSKVFSVGSISYTGSLAVDSVISQMTKNVLDNFLQ